RRCSPAPHAGSSDPDPELRPANRSPTSRATTPMSWTWKRALVSPADDQPDPDDLHPADTTLNLGLDARCIMTARRSYSIARQDTGLNGVGSTGTGTLAARIWAKRD